MMDVKVRVLVNEDIPERDSEIAENLSIAIKKIIFAGAIVTSITHTKDDVGEFVGHHFLVHGIRNK